MPLGTEVGIGTGHIVLDGDSFPHKRSTAAPTFRPMYIVTVWLDGSKCHLVRRSRPRPRLHYVVDEDRASPRKGHSSPIQLSAHVYGGQTAGWIKMPLGTEAGLGLGNTVLDGDPPAPRKQAQQLPSTFGVQTAAGHVYCRETVAHLS